MASVPKEFVNIIKELKGLRANKDYTKFHYRFKSNGKEYYRTIDYKNMTWTTAVRKREEKRNSTKRKS